MLCKWQLSVVATILVGLSGCQSASQSVLQSGGQAFSNGTAAVSKVLSNEISAAPSVERQFNTFNELPAAYKTATTYDPEFTAFACAGLQAGTASSASLATATQVANTVGNLTAAPSSNLTAVLASISKYQDAVTPTISLPKPPSQSLQSACQADVKASLQLLRPGAVAPRFAAGAVGVAISALQALYASAQTLVTAIAQTDDIRIREQLLIKFLSDPNTDKAMVGALGDCAHYSDALVNADGTLKTLPPCTGPLAKGGELDVLFARHIASTLVTAYSQYVDTKNAEPKLLPHEIVERLDTVQTNLAAFDAIRAQSAPGDLATPIATAYVNLCRLSAGKLTADERRQSFSDDLSQFYSLMTELYQDVTDLQTKAQSAQQAVNKL